MDASNAAASSVTGGVGVGAGGGIGAVAGGHSIVVAVTVGWLGAAWAVGSDGGVAYLGCRGWKKDRIDGWARVLPAGSIAT